MSTMRSGTHSYKSNKTKKAGRKGIFSCPIVQRVVTKMLCDCFLDVQKHSCIFATTLSLL